MADVLVDAWEGAALRTRLVRNGRPLEAVLDFYFAAVAAR
jgi:TetR/AcrR family transcriptional repressor of nem operon